MAAPGPAHPVNCSAPSGSTRTARKNDTDGDFVAMRKLTNARLGLRSVSWVAG